MGLIKAVLSLAFISLIVISCGKQLTEANAKPPVEVGPTDTYDFEWQSTNHGTSRYENAEVVCYEFTSGVQCKWKQ